MEYEVKAQKYGEDYLVSIAYICPECGATVMVNAEFADSMKCGNCETLAGEMDFSGFEVLKSAAISELKETEVQDE